MINHEFVNTTCHWYSLFNYKSDSLLSIWTISVNLNTWISISKKPSLITLLLINTDICAPEGYFVFLSYFSNFKCVEKIFIVISKFYNLSSKNATIFMHIFNTLEAHFLATWAHFILW